MRISYLIIRFTVAALLFCPLLGCGGDGADDSSSDSDSTSTNSGAGGSTAAAGGSGAAAGGGGTPMGMGMDDGGGGGAPMGMEMDDGGGGGAMAMGGMDPGMMTGGGDPSGGGYPGMEMGMDDDDEMNTNMAMMNQMQGGYDGADGSYADGGGPGGGYPGAGGGYPGGSAGQGGGNGLPANALTWNNDQILTAVSQKDARVLQAIEAKSGDPAFPQLASQILGGASAPAMGPGGFGLGGPGTGGAGGGGLLESLLGGGAGPPAGNDPPPVPRKPTGSTPPGGASQQRNQLTPSQDRNALDSLDVMIGESLLGYAPQFGGNAGVMAGAQQIGNQLGQQGGRGPGGRGPGGAGPGGAQGGIPGAAAGQPGAFPGQAGGQPGAFPGQAGPGGQYPGMQQGGQPGGGAFPGQAGPGGGYPGMGEDEYGGGNEGYGQFGGGQFGGQQGAPLQGNLQQRDLVEAVIKGLVRNNSPQAWALIDQITAGTLNTSLTPEQNSELVLAAVFSAREADPGRATAMLTTAVNQSLASPDNNRGTLRILAGINKSVSSHFMGLTPQDVRPTQSQPGQQGQPGFTQGGAGMQPGFGAGPGMQAGMQPGQGAGQGAGAQYPGQQFPGAQFGPGQGSESYEEQYGGMDESMAGQGGFGQPGGFGQQGIQPQPAVASAVKPIHVSEALMIPAAKVLWSRNVQTQLTALLKGASVTSSPELFAYATSMPSKSVRAELFKSFSQSFVDGPGELSTTFRDYAGDPGILAILKALPRQKSRPTTGAAANAPQTPKEGWIAATEEAVLNLRDRLKAVSGNADLAYTGRPPVRLHKNAVAERSIHIAVPDPTNPLEDSAPEETKLFYTRVPVQGANDIIMKSIVNHYRSQGLRREDRPRGILWFDGVRKNNNGTIQTMDVVISQNSPRQQQGGAYGDGGGAGFGTGGPGYGGGPGQGGFGQQQGGASYTIEIIVTITAAPDAVEATDDAQKTVDLSQL